MHLEARKFLDYVNKNFAHKFFKGKVLDVGSADINGNNRGYFQGSRCQYFGCDVFPGPNVDIVCKCHELPCPDESFDVILSSGCFEHDMYFRQTLRRMTTMLKPGGLMFFTCASKHRAEHGTLKHHPSRSYTTKLNNTKWNNYYRNLSVSDIENTINLPRIFSYYRIYYNKKSKDLYFIGIKKDSHHLKWVDYQLPYVQLVSSN